MYRVYRIVTPTGFYYYGSTGSTLRHRLWCHKGMAKIEQHRKLYTHINSNWEGVRIEEVEVVGGKAEGREREQHYIGQSRGDEKCLNEYDAYDTPESRRAKRTEAQRRRRAEQTPEQKEARRLRHNELQRTRRVKKG